MGYVLLVKILLFASADASPVMEHANVQGSGIQQAFRWTAAEGMVGMGWLPGGIVNSSTALGVSADGSVVVGSSSAANGAQPFRWTAAAGMQGLGLPAGAAYGRATGISGDASTIIGHHGFSNRNRAFRWTAAAGMTQLGFLPGDNVSEASAVSFDGSVIVGKSTVDFNPPRAFIWDQTNGMRELKAVLLAGNPHLAGWTPRDALSVSADGKTIVGWGKNPNGDNEGFTAELNSVITITGFSPASGVPGSRVTIFGNRFTYAGNVRLNGALASFVDDSDNQITAIVPAGASSGPLSVMNPSDTATSASNFIVLADSDGDGMSDNFEQQYFGSATAGAPGIDADGDGQTNLQELIAGTNPVDAKSVFRIMEVRRQGNDAIIVFRALAGKRYRVEAGENLADGFPIAVATLAASPSDITREVSHTGGAAFPRRFYRAVVLP